MSDEIEGVADDTLVECSEHGVQPRGYVCEHLYEGSKQGFVASTDEPDNPFPDAWCRACEEIRQAHGGWNEHSEKQLSIHIVCGACYQLIRGLNEESA